MSLSVVLEGRKEDDNNEEETSLHCSLPLGNFLFSVLGPLLTNIDIGNNHVFTYTFLDEHPNYPKRAPALHLQPPTHARAAEAV